MYKEARQEVVSYPSSASLSAQRCTLCMATLYKAISGDARPSRDVPGQMTLSPI